MCVELNYYCIADRMVTSVYLKVKRMSYDEFTAAAERKRLKAERKEANKLAWAERNKLLKTKKPIGVSPKDDKSRMQEFKEMLLRADNAPRIISKIISKALDDKDKDQAAMLKMCADRFLPVSMFEDAEAKGGITIIIDKTCGGTVTLKEGGVLSISQKEPHESVTIENGE